MPTGQCSVPARDAPFPTAKPTRFSSRQRNAASPASWSAVCPASPAPRPAASCRPWSTGCRQRHTPRAPGRRHPGMRCGQSSTPWARMDQDGMPDLAWGVFRHGTSHVPRRPRVRARPRPWCAPWRPDSSIRSRSGWPWYTAGKARCLDPPVGSECSVIPRYVPRSAHCAASCLLSVWWLGSLSANDPPWPGLLDDASSR